MEWLEAELARIATTDDLHISPLRDDGTTYGTPTWIWSVVVEDVLYVRAYNGQRSRWYQAAIKQKAGRIIAAGMTIDVGFEPVDGAVNEAIDEAIDEAYRAKYGNSSYLGSMISPRARAATVRIAPFTIKD
ncbi:DUF2255 family protein [Rhizobium sp. 18055]|uniref:DUF2255 family protein n=1 Tax=Rhizobium sp. 18055 TaxID=2681403 RepID=UPI00135A567B|nr:DUF2255 family protein [Rhizobium sp. 18055]